MNLHIDEPAEVTRAQRLKITRHVAALNKILEEIRETHPDANWYLEDKCNLHLLSGHSHDSNGAYEKARPDRIMGSWFLKGASGGGW